MTEDKMHKDFEAWARRSGRTEAQLHRGSGGDYTILGVHWEWMAWQAATRAAVPDGWKVVPLEPTPEMIEEGEKAHWSKEMDKMSPTPTEFYDECGGPIGYAWVAMLAAAPEVKP